MRNVKQLHKKLSGWMTKTFKLLSIDHLCERMKTNRMAYSAAWIIPAAASH